MVQPSCASAAPDRASAPPRRQFVGRRCQRAFTIMEVVMATMVLAFGITTSIVSIQVGFRQIDLARNTTIAAQIIESEMERLRMMNWVAICANSGTQTITLSTTFASNSNLASKFTVTQTIADNATFPGEMKDLTILVTWTGTDGQPHERKFTAVYAQNGLYDYYYTVAHPATT